MKSRLLRFLLLMVLLATAFFGYKIVRWRAYVWLPDYLVRSFRGPERISASPVHIVLVFVDHYEPGHGEEGAAKNRRWLEEYKALADRHQDSYGRKPQHTWFYAYEHRNDAVMRDLSEAAREGYGEVEFHWHHGNDTDETFEQKLSEALKWFNSFGAMLSADADSSVRFAFVHGNCALDNSGPPEFCGVSWELDILRRAGCYADFTFPSLGSPGQPSKVNSIYYARDDEGPKSYHTGRDAAVGRRAGDELLIFQGPLVLAPTRELFVYGAVEDGEPPAHRRVDRWISARIALGGRPEWVFVKVHTHGMQSARACLEGDADEMFSYLEDNYGSGAFRLHYVTAREAFNIVRAAEDRFSGDPDLFRDYEVKPPLNKCASGQ